MKKSAFLFLAIFLFLLGIGSLKVFAGYRPPFGGEYTNLCGSGFDATFYNCPANCNINEGWCETQSGQWIYVFVCGGRTGECRENMFGPTTGRHYLTSYASVGSNKTVQIDVFNKICTEGGGWSCGPDNLKGYIVWYSGQVINRPPNVITLPPVETY